MDYQILAFSFLCALVVYLLLLPFFEEIVERIYRWLINKFGG